MHKEILSKEQTDLLPLVAAFKKEYYLVGGTAIALHIGHRRSIDFDLFKKGGVHSVVIISKISSFKIHPIVTRRVSEQLNLIANNVKFTFFNYPFDIPRNCTFDKTIKLPDLLTLASMKAFAMGQRSKWKDYVDLYYMLKQYYSINEISEKATALFQDLFSKKLFKAQLCYFNDIDYSEAIEFMPGFEVSEKTVRDFLTDVATVSL